MSRGSCASRNVKSWCFHAKFKWSFATPKVLYGTSRIETIENRFFCVHLTACATCCAIVNFVPLNRRVGVITVFNVAQHSYRRTAFQSQLFPEQLEQTLNFQHGIIRKAYSQMNKRCTVRYGCVCSWVMRWAMINTCYKHRLSMLQA